MRFFKRKNRKEIVVLVPGFGAFNREDNPLFHYWGGHMDLSSWLLREGLPLISGDCGPVSSNWDRACELYAFLAGGRTDYGRAHSERFGHRRYGTEFPGVLPDLGTRNGPLLHLLGHSMGGQTARMLIHLLEEGSREERDATPSEDLSPLFRGGRRCVRSCMTLATPHNGTSLTTIIQNRMGLVRTFLAFLAEFQGTGLLPFRFKMDHWEILRRQEGESLRAYRNRMFSLSFWENEKDQALYDLSPEGAFRMNLEIPASPGVYYFSVSMSATYRDPLLKTEIPRLGIHPALAANALYLSRQSAPHSVLNSGPVSWKVSDGMVNTLSMKAPVWGSRDRVTELTGLPGQPAGALRKGVWHSWPVLENFDHWKQQGWSAVSPVYGLPGPVKGLSLPEWYRDLMQFLLDLPY